LRPWMAMFAARLGWVFSQARIRMLDGRSVSERQLPSRISLRVGGTQRRNEA
jgi:hypothetical protein